MLVQHHSRTSLRVLLRLEPQLESPAGAVHDFLFLGRTGGLVLALDILARSAGLVHHALQPQVGGSGNGRVQRRAALFGEHDFGRGIGRGKNRLVAVYSAARLPHRPASIQAESQLHPQGWHRPQRPAAELLDGDSPAHAVPGLRTHPGAVCLRHRWPVEA